MNLDFIAGILKPYIPTITTTYLPRVSASIAGQLAEEDARLQDGEVETVYMLSRQGDEVVLRTVRLDANAKVVRSTQPVPVATFLSDLIANALQTQ